MRVIFDKWGDATIQLSWPSALTVSSFMFERSDDRGDTWSPISGGTRGTYSDGPCTPAMDTYDDAGLDPGTYDYRLSGA